MAGRPQLRSHWEGTSAECPLTKPFPSPPPAAPEVHPRCREYRLLAADQGGGERPAASPRCRDSMSGVPPWQVKRGVMGSVACVLPCGDRLPPSPNRRRSRVGGQPSDSVRRRRLLLSGQPERLWRLPRIPEPSDVERAFGNPVVHVVVADRQPTIRWKPGGPRHFRAHHRLR